MRVMKYVFIHPKVGLWSDIKNKRIRDEERSLGFFLGLYLKESKLTYSEFDGIFFEGLDIFEQSIYIKNRLLVVPVYMSENDYPNEVNRILINDYLIEKIIFGINKIKDSYQELFDLILKGVEEFKKNDYVCKWLHKKKKSGKLIVELRCLLDVSIFQLDLTILDSKLNVVFEKVVLSTPPNEYSFKHRFKDLVIVDDLLYITDSSDNKFFEMNLSDFR